MQLRFYRGRFKIRLTQVNTVFTKLLLHLKMKYHLKALIGVVIIIIGWEDEIPYERVSDSTSPSAAPGDHARSTVISQQSVL